MAEWHEGYGKATEHTHDTLDDLGVPRVGEDGAALYIHQRISAYGDKRAREAVDDGYTSAFYELAGLLGMTAQPLPPAQVWHDQMLPQIKAALRDAKRYRWLRAPARGEACGDEPCVGIDSAKHPNRWALSDAEADAAIDAAMLASAPTPGEKT